MPFEDMPEIMQSAQGDLGQRSLQRVTRRVGNIAHDETMVGARHFPIKFVNGVPQTAFHDPGHARVAQILLAQRQLQRARIFIQRQ